VFELEKLTELFEPESPTRTRVPALHDLAERLAHLALRRSTSRSKNASVSFASLYSGAVARTDRTGAGMSSAPIQEWASS
jgi:hypothetical protein